MIDPNEITTKRVGELPPADFNLTDNLPHEIGTDLTRGTVQQLADLIGGYLGTTDSLAFNPITVSDGGTLPATTSNEWMLVGKGTFHNVGGQPDIITTEELNALTSNGSYWSLAVEIPINVELAGITQNIRSGYTTTTPSEDAVYQALALKLDTSALTTNNVVNNSGVSGDTATEALDTLNTLKANLASPIFTGTPTAPTPTTANGIVNKSYADGLVVGLLDDRGNWDASGNLFPTTGGSGTAGAVLKGDLWYVSVAGILGGKSVAVGDSFRALVNTPGQTAGNWSVFEANIGYVPENVANKSDSYTVSSSTTYSSSKALVDGLATKQNALVNPITGTGTANRVSKWGSSSSQVDSQISDNGTSVNILTSDSRLVGGDSTGRLVMSNSTTTSYIGLNGATHTTPNEVQVVTTTGNIRMLTNSLERFTILNNGNTGVGVTAPTSRLSTSSLGNVTAPTSGSGAEAGLFVGASNNLVGMLFGASQSTGAGWIQATRVDGTATNYNLNLNPNGGNVGIGTTTPVGKLDVVGSKTTTYTANLTSPTIDFARVANSHNSGGADQYSSIALSVSGNNGANNAYANLSVIQPTAASNSSDFSIALRQSGGTMSEVFRALANGNVGIGSGTGAPNYNLNLNSNAVSSYMQFTSTTSGATQLDGLIIGIGASNESAFINRENSPMVFHTNNTEKARIHASGGVSIGNTTDTGAGTLNVTGAIFAPTAAAGTNTTQVATTAFVQASARPYKVYTATLTQTGTAAPVATILENTTGQTVTWTRTATGLYSGTFSGAGYVAGKRFASVSPRTGGIIMYDFLSTAVFQLATASYGGAGTDALLNETSVEIRIYP